MRILLACNLRRLLRVAKKKGGAREGRLIVCWDEMMRWDDNQEDEGLKKEGADMAKEASSGLGGENVDKNNDLWLKKGMNSSKM